MQSHEIKRKNPLKKSQSVGRGGKRGKTSGRGGKGQTARAGNKRRPELRDLIKKLPKLRGRGVNMLKTLNEDATPVNLDVLEVVYSNGETVSPKTLIEKGVIKLFKGMEPRVKILGTGELSKKLVISGCEISAPAKAKFEKAGGTIAK